MTDLIISPHEVTEVYRPLHKLGCLGDHQEAGFLRAAYSDEETAAIKYIEAWAKAAGGISRWDGIGNLAIEWPGASAKFVEVGSHLDTVPFGGNFDGAAGIVAGVLAIKNVVAENAKRNIGLRLRIWRGEESATFNTLYIGSLGAFGKFNSISLSHQFRGLTLEAAMRMQGADPELLRRAERTILQEEVDGIVAHIELHIEQGNLLEVGQVDVGIVTGIRGPRRFRVTLEGQFDHSGATPMGVNYRRDVNLAMAHMIVELDQLAGGGIAAGDDLVQTVGVINSNRDFNETFSKVYENAVPKVSGFGYFTLDIRSRSESVLDSYCARMESLVREVADQFRITAGIELLGKSAPLEKLDVTIQDILERSAAELGISTIRMPSGAGHDAAIVGSQRKSDGTPIPVGMIFIPCRGGKSHSPEEFASDEAIARGAAVLAVALKRLAYDQ